MGAGVGCEWGGHITMSSGLISNNTATGGGGGGGVLVGYPDSEGDVSFVMTGGEISNNKAEAYDGGGISILNTQNIDVEVIIGKNDGDDIPVIKNNTSVKSGGGIFSYANPIIMNEGKIFGNTASSIGGGISLYNKSSLTMNGGIIGDSSGAGNQADRGGGIGTNASVNMIKGNKIKITGNIAHSTTVGGGGVFISNGSKASFEASTIENNQAALGHGGGIYVMKDGELIVTGKTYIIDNNASQEGGGIYTAGVEEYVNLIDTDYQNISTSAQTVFEKNVADEAYLPPEIVGNYNNVNYDKTSIILNNEYIHPINNYDINYRGELLPISYTVIYNDGVENKIVFEDQVYRNIEKGKDTPSFVGEPTRKGYIFIGWEPEVAKIVTEDAIYKAQWEKTSTPDEPNPPKPDPSDKPNIPEDDSRTIKSSQTGDNINIILPIILIIFSIGIMSIVITKRKKI